MFTIRAGLDCGVVCDDDGCGMIRRFTGVLGALELGTLKADDRVCFRGVSGVALATASYTSHKYIAIICKEYADGLRISVRSMPRL